MRLLLLLAAAALSANADVTLRYKIDSTLPSGFDTAPVLRMKGAKGATNLGRKSTFEMHLETAELSTAPLDGAVFQVPEGFAGRPAEELLQNTAPVDTTAQAFIPHLDPVEAPHRDYSDTTVVGIVHLLVTVGSDGKVIDAEPLGGPAQLRPLALADVRKYLYRPVLRDGKPVVAITEATLFYLPPGTRPPAPNLAESMGTAKRLADLQAQFPRTPEQVLADLEHDVGDRTRFYITDLATAALDADDLDKAEAYAKQALAAEDDDWNSGNRMHYGHIVLGRAALRRDNLPQARAELLAAGKTKGSPQLDSFGPDVVLAKALLEKGETAAVLEYLAEVRAFWKMGGSRLDSWTEAIKAGNKPS